jgi:HK97 family phage major capsid protein
MQLAAIREAKSIKVAEMRTLASSAETMTAEAKTRFDALKTEVVALEADEARAQFLEDAERRTSGQPVDKSRRDMESRVTVLDAIACQVENRSATGALAEYQAEAKRMGIEAKKGGMLVPSSLFEKRATQTTTSNASVVPDDFKSSEFVGLLRNSLLVKQLGARVLPGLRGDTVIPKQTGTATAYWIAEGDSLTESGVTFSSIKLEPRHVGALSSLSRQLIQQANPAIEQLVRDDFSQVVSLAVDAALLHGAAADDQPVGILNVSGIQTANLATLSWANVIAMLEKLGLENITPNAWIASTKAATKLKTTLVAASAGSEFLMQGGRMADLPVHAANQLLDKGTTTKTGRLIAGDFSQLVIGEWGATEILANPYAAGYFEKGDVQLRILHTMDAVVRHPKAFVVADDITL